jgi:ubiquinol-cytochrome c reductase cytochrome c subunit
MGTGGAYTLFTSIVSTTSTRAYAASGTTVQDGQKLFAANCASCHGVNAEGAEGGPSLIGVSAAAVDFQLSSGQMPPRPRPVKLTQPQIDSLVAYLASLAPAGEAPGPAAPDEKYLKGDGDAAVGAELFRINCAACHNIAGAGGALTQGKSAPEIADASARRVYQAMLAGPQNMPVFSDTNLTPQQKADIITALKYNKENPSPGGFDLGSLGPFSEGLFILIFGLGTIVGVTIWLSARAK